MARLPRISPVGVPLHIIQRGNNRQVLFASDEDNLSYTGWLKEYSNKYQVDIHAWVMMTNHTYILCAPRQEVAVSRMVQSLGRRYVRGILTMSTGHFGMQSDLCTAHPEYLNLGVGPAERQDNYRNLFTYYF